MATSVAGSGIEIAGSLKRLPPLPNAEHQRLFNAENCTVSAEGKVFITGSTAANEILAQSQAFTFSLFLRHVVKLALRFTLLCSVVWILSPQSVEAAGRYTVRSDGTMLDNGMPFFPFGFYLIVQQQDDSKRNQYVDELSAGGFDLAYFGVISGLNSGSVFDNAYNKNVHIIFQSAPLAGRIAEYINVYKAKPALMGYFTGDDINMPCGNPRTSVAAHFAEAQVIKNLDPDHLTVGNYVGDPSCKIKEYAGADDVMVHYGYFIDNWLTHDKQLEQNAVAQKYVYDQLKASGKQKISLWTGWQTFKWPDRGQYPTRAELRNLLYASIIYGVKGVSSYAYVQDTVSPITHLPTDAPYEWDEAKILRNEVTQLAPVLLDGVETLINPGSPYVEYYHAAVWQYNGDSYVIVVNTYRHGSKTISITLPSSVSGTLQPMFVRRPSGMVFDNTTKVLSGTVNDDEVHIYKIGSSYQ